MAPVFKWPMAGYTQAATRVRGGHETDKQWRAGVVEGSEAELVDQNKVVAQQNADDLADGVVSQTAIQRFDQVRGHNVADLHAALRCACAAADQGVALARAAGSNQ